MKQETQKLNKSMGSSICEVYAKRFFHTICWKGGGKNPTAYK